MGRRNEARSSRRAAGQLEGDILATLWAAPGPMSPADVQAALPGELAYNTVHTILTRLSGKGLVARELAGRTVGYRPTKDAAQVAVDQMRAALGAGADRTAVLQRFVSSLDRDDERALRALFDGDARQ